MNGRLPQQLFVLFIVLLFGVLLVFINIVAHQYNLRIDLTQAGQHTLSSHSADYLKKLDRDIKVTVLFVGVPPKYLEDMLSEYELHSRGRIKQQIIDPLDNLGYASQFGNIITGKQQKVVVQSGVNRQDVDFTDDVLTEELLTNAIIRVVRPQRKVYFLAGHNEYKADNEDEHSLSILSGLMANNNMIASEILLTQGASIPSDCAVLVVAGPKTQLTPDELKAIGKYLANGGDALFLIEHTVVTTPDKPLTKEEFELNPSLNEILENWGIKVNKDVVVDLTSHASGDVGSPATKNYMSHRAIVSGLDYTFYVRPRSISILPQRRKTLKVAPVVMTQSAEQSWGESDRTLNVKYDEKIDRPGPVPIVFAVWEQRAEGEASDTRILVFTDADFLTNAYIGSYSNAQMGLNALNWLSELDYQTFLDKKKFEVRRLDLTSQQKKNVLLVLIIMPVVIALAGIIVWLRKR